MTKKVYHRDPEMAQGVLDRVDELLAQGAISDELATALYIAVGHQSVLDYDALHEAYMESDSDEIRQVMIDSGVVIMLDEAHTRAVKYGV